MVPLGVNPDFKIPLFRKGRSFPLKVPEEKRLTSASL